MELVLVLCAALAARADDSRKASRSTAKHQRGGVEHSVSAKDLDGYIGAKADIVLTSGKRFTDITITGLVRGKDKDTIRLVVYKTAKGKRDRRHRASAVTRIIINQKPYDVVRDPVRKAHLLIDVTERIKTVTARLKAKGDRLWPALAEKRQAEAVDEHKQYLKKVGEAFPDRPLKLYETKFFLLLTDK